MLRGVHSIVEQSMGHSADIYNSILSLAVDISDAICGYLVCLTLPFPVNADAGLLLQYLVDPVTGSLHLKASNHKDHGELRVEPLIKSTMTTY